jgi:hypothetical protein
LEVRGYRVYYIGESMEPAEVIDMIRNSKAEKIALVIHNEQEIVTDKYSLNLLNRFNQETAKDIAIITPDKKFSKKLKSSDLKVFSHLEALEKAEEVDKTRSSQKINRVRPIYLLGIFVIILLAGIYFLYPTVTIEISPVTASISKNFEVKGSIKSNALEWEKKILPIHEFEVTLTDKETLATTGKRIIGTSKARGIVKFINERNKEVIVPDGTIIKTSSGKKFKTLKESKIPSLKVDYLMDVPVGMKAGQVEVKIESLVKGSKGNVNTGAINQWENNIENVYVINPEPTIGGKNEKLSIVSKNDIQHVKEELLEKIKDKLISRIYKKLGGNYRIVEDEIRYSNIEYDFNGGVNDRLKELEGTGTMKASGFLLRNNEVDKMATYIIKEKVKEDYHLLNNGVNVSDIKLEKNEAGMYNIKLELEAQVVPKVETAHLAKELAGKSLGNAVNVLASNQNINKYEIHNKMDILPMFRYAIKIIVKEPDSLPVMSINN